MSFAADGAMGNEEVPLSKNPDSSIARDIGDEYPKEIIATTIAAFALSSVLTGLTFFLLGYLRLGSLIGFFPRHILVGCIGGVGVFLILTGLTVSTRLSSDALDPPTMETIRYFIFNTHALAQWVPPLVLAVLLRVITMRWKHQLVFPIYFMIIPLVFYVVVAAAQLDLGALMRDGWLFDMAEGTGDGEDKWYGYHSYLDLGLIQFTSLWTTLPIQIALHVFHHSSVSLDEDVDTNKELLAHGYSNILSGCLGTVPNCLVCVDTLLFYRVGGRNRIADFLLAVATFILLMIGTGPIAYIPVMVVSSLVFVLGIDLVKEALWDTRHRVSRMEYITIVSIMVTMTAWDFVIGVLFGMVVSCENIVEDATWKRNPVRFVVVDLSLVVGVDMSAAEAFVRVQRLLAAKGVVVVFCGVTADSPCGKALSSVGILQEPSVEVFEMLNDAMEWTENAYLQAWFRAQKSWTTPTTLPDRQDTSLSFDETLMRSPRQMQLRDVGERTIAGGRIQNSSEPYNTLLNAFSSYHDVDQNTFKEIAPYFERFTFPDGFVLWETNDTPDGLYIIESGILRASYKFAEHSPVIDESMVSGTLAGELSALSGMPRNA
ncbi:hypothetical protein P692DRAFT_20851426 [Suillus brevipes Sb2]|nr:hypothetical protein P692DRAFT_20851426 [Suillus brevipes Sb2]